MGFNFKLIFHVELYEESFVELPLEIKNCKVKFEGVIWKIIFLILAPPYDIICKYDFKNCKTHY